MDQLDLIIEEGTKLNGQTIEPTINERLNLKVNLLKIISQLDKDIFVMNRELFYWKKLILSGEITLPNSISELTSSEFSEKISEWLLEPLLVFCNNLEENAKMITKKMHEEGYSYVRARNDEYPTRINIDIDFEVAAILVPINKNIMKQTDNIKLFGVNINFNGEVMLPIFLYNYLTPRFNFEKWKKDLELEPYLWVDMQEKWVKKGVEHPQFNSLKNKEISNKVYNLIKTENEGTYLFTGYFTYFLMTSQDENFNGEYHIYHENPIEFMKKLNEEISGLKVKEEQPMYYFQDKYYQIFLNGEAILTIYDLKYSMNYIRLGFYNHTNYHGVLLFLLLEAIKAPLKESDEKISHIGYLIKYRNNYLKKENGRKNIFEILQNETVGPDNTPFLEFKKKEWNKELTFFYRPDKEEAKDESKSEDNEKA